MTQKDFKVKNGVIVGGNIASTTNGFVFDYTANTLSVGGSLVATAGTINTVQDNVTALTTSVNTISANVDSVQSNVLSLTTSVNTIKANVDSVASNVSSLTTSTNTIKANVDSVQSNVTNIVNGTSQFTGNITIQQDLTVQGNLIVGGSSTVIESTDTVVKDRVITLANGAVAGSFDSGLYISRGTSGNVFVGFDESADQFVAAYTNDAGGNTVTDFTLVSYANAHFNNIVVEGTVDGVDVSGLQSQMSGFQTNINTVQDNVTALTTTVNTIKANVDLVSSNVSNLISGATAFTGNISAPRVILNTQVQVGSNVTSSVGTAATTVFTFPGASYRGVELTILTQDITNSAYQLSKMLVVHDGNVVDWTEYGIIHTGNDILTSFTAAIDASDVVTVTSTGGSANKKITVASHYFIQ